MLQNGSLAAGDSMAYSILSSRKSLWFKYSLLKDVCTEKKKKKRKPYVTEYGENNLSGIDGLNIID